VGVVAGTAGHVDHGKSSLMRRLTGVDPDRLEEEKLRGITIELGYVFMPLPDGGVLAFIDVPGHERFVRQMVAGVATVDFFLLVVAADEGVMPQTREHLDILRLLGVKRGLVALTKCDLVDADLQDLAEAEIEELLAAGGYAGSRIYRVSSLTGAGMEELRSALIEMAVLTDRSSTDGRFRLSIDRVFTLQGHGTIVAGTVLAGAVNQGDTLELLPGGRQFRVREMRVNEGRTRGAGTPGDRVALNLVGLEREEAHRGSCLATPGWLSAPTALDTEMTLLPGCPLRMRQRVRFHCGTAEVMARAIPMEGSDLAPGETGYVHFQLEEPVVSMPGDRFVIRRFSPVTTIGGGVILESDTAKVRLRNRDDRIRRVEMLAGGDLGGFLMERLKARPSGGLSISEAAREVGRTPEEMNEAAAALVSSGAALLVKDGSSERLVPMEHFQTASGTIVSALRAYHAERPLSRGLPTASVPKVLTWLPQWYVKGLMAKLSEDGTIVKVGERVALSGHPAELTAAQLEEIETRLSEIDSAGFAGFEAAYMDAAVLDSLLERGLVLELEKGIVSTPAMARKAHGLLAERFGDGEFRLGEMRELMGISRRTAVLWAGLLDGMGMTVRNGELRTVGRSEE